MPKVRKRARSVAVAAAVVGVGAGGDREGRRDENGVMQFTDQTSGDDQSDGDEEAEGDEIETVANG